MHYLKYLEINEQFRKIYFQNIFYIFQISELSQNYNLKYKLRKQ